MIATFVFLDQFSAFRVGTLLGKSFEPSHIFILIFFFIFPRFDLRANAGRMILFQALETESVATIAVDDRLARSIGAINDFFAAFSGTPLKEPALVRKLLGVPLDVLRPIIYSIFFALFIFEVIHHKAVRHDHVAIILLAFQENTLRVILHLDFYVICPADSVILMSAHKGLCLIFLIIVLKVTVASLTGILVKFCP